MNLNANRSSPHLGTNGVSSFSGKTRPSVTGGAAGALASFTRELQNCARTDSELWKSCETRWLQLFRVVEQQCEEQIAVQQERFRSQILRIQEEIRNLVRLQTNNAPWAACGRSLSAQVPAEGQMGFFPESNDRNDAIVTCAQPGEPETQQEARAPQPNGSADGSSVSSGYGTFCISELNTSKSNSGHFMEHETEPAGLCGTPEGQAGPREPRADCASSLDPQAAEDFCEDASLFSGELARDFLGKSKISEVYSGEKNSKAITSWAQKLKQSQPKRVPSEEACSNSVRASRQASNGLPEKPDSSASRLSKPEGLPAACMSDSGAGLLYWKLQEKDMYHSLPGPFGRPPSPSQFNASNEMKLPSLTDIYHKKQRGNVQFPERGLSSLSHPDRPPEVLTLDPALHRKPGPHAAAAHPQGFRSVLGDRVSSPDSVLGPALSSHCDMDAFSQASRVTSQSSGFCTSPPNAKASPGDPWESHGAQHDSRPSSTLASGYATTSSATSVSSGQEGAAGTVPPVSIPATASSGPECVSSASLGDPVLMSQVRQSLKEKHARHVADLRAYYESEINSLKQRLEAEGIRAVGSWKQANQVLIERCDQLDGALSEATGRVRRLESKNSILEAETSDLRDRFRAASTASRALQERIEELRASCKEKDGTVLRLQARLQGMEEAVEGARQLSDERAARLQQEGELFRNLLLEYESLGKEHQRVKEALSTAESKLLDAHVQISDLKRTVAKLEAQVRQVEHENRLGLRHLRAPTGPSRANAIAAPDVSRRKWLVPGAEHSIFTGQPLAVQDRAESPLEKACVPGCCSPHEDSPPGSPPVADPRDASDAPIMKALKQLEGEELQSLSSQTDAPGKSVSSHLTGASISASRPPEKCPQPRPRRSHSAPQRSSSLPPSSRKPGTPTRRDIMLTPVTATYSPKRSPKENLSPGFSHLLSRSGSGPVRSDILLDDLDTAAAASAPHARPRRRLELLPPADAEEQPSEAAAHLPAPAPACSSPPAASPGAVQQGPEGPLEKQHPASPGQGPPGGDFEYTAKIRTLAETERFFDELTKEKGQIEAALSRMPSTGGRATLQTRLNQEALEDRLERVNRELGSVRMTLKKFHVLRSCANL